MFVVLTAFGILLIVGWRLSTAIHQQWYISITIPRIVRRQCTRIDEEYRALCLRPDHRPH